MRPISVRLDDTDDRLSADRQRELKARAYYLDLAAQGDAEAKLLLRTHWRLTKLTWRGKEVF